MEYAKQGTLRDFILKNNKIDEKTAYILISQMAIGLGELHVQNVIHRDYKSMNIFLNDNLLKIGDLGVSFLCQTVTGSPYYLAPELCKGEPYTYAVDIYAFGVTIYELLNQGHHPFEAQNQAALLVNILKGKYQQLSQRYSKKLQQLVYSCLNQNPKNRPNIFQILLDFTIQKIIKDNRYKLSQKLSQKLQELKIQQQKSQIQQIKTSNINVSQNQQQNITEIQSETIQLTTQSSEDDFDEDETQSSQSQQNQQQIDQMNQLMQKDSQLFKQFEGIIKNIKRFKLPSKIEDQILQYYRLSNKPVFKDIQHLLDNINIDKNNLEKILIQYGNIQNQRQQLQKQINALLK